MPPLPLPGPGHSIPAAFYRLHWGLPGFLNHNRGFHGRIRAPLASDAVSNGQHPPSGRAGLQAVPGWPLHLVKMDAPGEQLLPLYSSARQLIGMVQVSQAQRSNLDHLQIYDLIELNLDVCLFR